MRLDEDGNAYKVDFVSIHASVKDATLWDYCIPFEGNVSIHASVKDATKALDFDRIYIRVSIHASVKDATSIQVLTYFMCLFQSTHL